MTWHLDVVLKVTLSCARAPNGPVSVLGSVWPLCRRAIVDWQVSVSIGVHLWFQFTTATIVPRRRVSPALTTISCIAKRDATDTAGHVAPQQLAPNAHAKRRNLAVSETRQP